MSAVDVEQLQPISRTYQYRKVMKPMLERKRRARINRCLDELKEFILSTLQAEGENVSKLEKADILEFTVQHLRRQSRASSSSSSSSSANANTLSSSNSNGGVTDADRFSAGFRHCASEVSRCLASTPGVDVTLGTKLLTHLGHRLLEMEKTSPLSVRVTDSYSPAPPSSPSSVSSSSESSYNMPLTPISMSSANSTCCSRNSSPCHPESHASLLTVMDMSMNKFASQQQQVWRPW